jgi:hypothetical protein
LSPNRSLLFSLKFHLAHLFLKTLDIFGQLPISSSLLSLDLKLGRNITKFFLIELVIGCLLSKNKPDIMKTSILDLFVFMVETPLVDKNFLEK